MKKHFLIAGLLAFMLSAVIAPTESKAQIVSVSKPVAAKDTLTNTDNTTIAIAVDNISRSVELYGLKRSGNVSSCSMILQGTVDGSNWDGIDTLTFTNITENYKVITLRASNGDFKYKTYRAYCNSAGTCTWEPRAYLHRRSN